MIKNTVESEEKKQQQNSILSPVTMKTSAQVKNAMMTMTVKEVNIDHVDYQEKDDVHCKMKHADVFANPFGGGTM